MNQWARNRTNNAIEKMAKSMPCHVTEVAKDFIKVAFETSNGIFTPPIVKIPQQFSQFSREPTQKGNKGYAVPGHYYLGGVTGDSGGNTNFYPRGNLTTLAFNPTSHTQNRERDYDQLTHMGGPNGWNIGAFTKQAGDNDGSQQQSGNQTSTAAVSRNVQQFKNDRARRMNIERVLMAKNRKVSVRSLSTPIVTPLDTTSSSGTGSGGSGDQQQTQQPQDQTTYNFDKNGTCTVQSKDADHNVTVDSQSKKITLNLPVGEWGYAGGDGKKGKYARIMTEDGPSVNFKARIG
jgi:hypothetical protein